MGATLVGEAVGRGRREVFFKTCSNVSAIMVTVLDGGAGIDSSPMRGKSDEGKLETQVIKKRKAE
jgi:hypothetical protein